jgi:hypothetical protein
MENERGVYRILVGKSKGKRQLGRQRLRWDNNIKVDVQAVESASMERCRDFVKAVMNFQLP